MQSFFSLQANIEPEETPAKFIGQSKIETCTPTGNPCNPYFRVETGDGTGACEGGKSYVRCVG